MSIRVLHVQDHTVPEMSGYAFRSRYLVETEAALGVRPEVVSSARHRRFSSLTEELLGLRFHRTPWPEGAWSRLQLRIPFWRERILTAALRDRILEVAEGFRPDLLHAHSPIFNGSAALAAGRRLRVPVVYHIRAFWEDDAVDKKKFKEGSFVYRQVRRIETGICREAALVVTICGGLRDDLAARGIPEEKILVVPNGVDGERFQPQDPDLDLKRRLGLEGKRVVGFVGSFFHYEGLPLLVEAAGLLRERQPDMRLLLVGGGEDEDRVRARIEELGLSGRVLLTGRVPHEDVASYYSIMDLLAYPRLSRRITELVTPLKPLEALAMQKAVVGSDVGGVKELLESCAAGRLFRAGSAEDLARVLSEALDLPPEQRARENAEARRMVLSRRRWESVVEPLVERYRSLCGAPRQAAGGSSPAVA